MSGRRAPSPELARARKGFEDYIEVIRRESLSVAQAGVELSEGSEFLEGLHAITLSSKMVLAFSDLLAEQIDDAARARLATVLEHSTRVVAAASRLSRHFDQPTATHMRAAKRRAADEARAVQAEDDAATLAIARPLILAALNVNGRVLNRDKLLDRVNEAITATKDRKGSDREKVVLRTLGRWITKVKKDRLAACRAE